MTETFLSTSFSEVEAIILTNPVSIAILDKLDVDFQEERQSPVYSLEQF